MAVIIVRQKVKDFAAWKSMYDKYSDTRKDVGVTMAAIHRDPDDQGDAADQPRDAKQLIALLQPGQPRDMADLITFLVGPDGAAVTGQVVRADGCMAIGA